MIEINHSVFFNGRFIIGNDYVRMYVVELRYTGGGVRSVRRGSWSRGFFFEKVLFQRYFCERYFLKDTFFFFQLAQAAIILSVKKVLQQMVF